MHYSLLLLTIACGGALGSLMRFQITHWLTRWLGNGFPYATLSINVFGSFLIGLLMAALSNGILAALHWRPFIAIGFLGALTTFSSFSLETFLLLQKGLWFNAILNTLLNVLLSLLAVAVGYMLIQRSPHF